MLNANDIPIVSLAEKFGTPLYIYDEKVITRRLNILKEHFKGFNIFYSFKSNPNPFICRHIYAQGQCADVASIGEMQLAKECGFAKGQIVYSAPGKSEEDIRIALGQCILIADSLNELQMINELCMERGIVEDIAVRINPEYSIGGMDALEIMSGVPGKFGIDQETLVKKLDYINALTNIRITGIQVYMGSQIIRYQIIVNNFQNILDIGLLCKKELGFPLNFIDFGGGFGIQYTEEDEQLDIETAGRLVRELFEMEKYREIADLRFMIESGRFISGPAGVYVCSVMDTKESRGKRYAIVDGGMNSFFRPMFIKENRYPVLVANKLHYPRNEKVTIAGVMCTPIDVFVEDILLPHIEKGDFITFLNAGAYGYTMSLTKFISHKESRELFITQEGSVLRDEEE